MTGPLLIAAILASLGAHPLPAGLELFAVFRRRNFTLLWIAQLISVAGSALTALAASILVYRLTGSAPCSCNSATARKSHRNRSSRTASILSR